MKCKSSIRLTRHLRKKTNYDICAFQLPDVLFSLLFFFVFFLFFIGCGGRRAYQSQQQARLSTEAHLSP